MKAAAYRGKHQVVVEEVPLPEVSAPYSLIRMSRCGVCGSDLHGYSGEWSHGPEWTGHEVSGRIAVCTDPTGSLKTGDRVCAECFQHCGHCLYCQTGKYNLCDALSSRSGRYHSGFAEYVVAHNASIFPLPDSVDDVEGAFVEPLAVAHRVFRKTALGLTDSLLIVGGGTIGLLVLAVARASGLARALVAARYEAQIRAARELAAAAVLSASGAQAQREILDLTGGRGADGAVVTTSSPEGMELALRSVRKSGRVVVAGGFSGPIPADFKRVVDGELELVGSSCYAYTGGQKDFTAAIELISDGRVEVRRLLTHEFPLSRIAEALAAAADKNTGSLKVQVYT
jgi:L-iditol 2-dehydrogenase